MALTVSLTVVGQGQPLLFLHSSLSSHRQWLPLVNELKSQFQCILVDLQGYGAAGSRWQPSPASLQPQQYCMAEESKPLLVELAALNLTSPITLIGHSFGGALALHLAQSQQIAVKQLILFEPVVFHLLKPENYQPQQTQRNEAETLLSEIHQLAAKLPTLSEHAAAECFIDYWQSHGFFAELPRKMQSTLAQQVKKVPFDFAALISEPCTLLDYQYLQQPILLMTGQSSRRSATFLAEQLASHMPNCQLRRVSSGHMGPVTHADVINPIIVEYLSQSEI